VLAYFVAAGWYGDQYTPHLRVGGSVSAARAVPG